MIDRAARAKVRLAVEDYFSDRITAFQFDDRLFPLAGARHDRTVQFVVDQLWYIYDDCDDHMIVADKTTWDRVQRLLLPLDSGGEVQLEKRRHWHGSQLFAACALLVVGGMCLIFWPLWPVPAFFGGLVSIQLSRWRTGDRDSFEPIDPWRCWPFQSLDELSLALDLAPEFRKHRYRSELASRRIRSPSESRAMWYKFLCDWLLFSPLALLAQLCPLQTRTPHIHFASAPGRS